MQHRLSKLFLFFLFFATLFGRAQVKFSATVSTPQISKNEMVQLRLMVENAQSTEQITPPAFSNFTVVSGPSQESGMTSINGNVSQYVAVSFILKPKGPGTFTIPAATAKADGKTLRSNPVTVRVTNSTAAATTNTSSFPGGFNPFDDAPRQAPFNDYILRKGENAADKIHRNMFVKLQTDKTSCYVGEPIVATYKLYTRLKSESNLVKNPSLSGFSVIDLQQPDNMNYTRETVNGREYNVYIIRKVQLYPLQSGNVELEAAQVENNVQFIKEEYARRQNGLIDDVFSEFAEAAIPAEGVERQKVTLENKPVTISVKELPATGVPAAFKGAVGNFSVKAALATNSFTTDDAGKLGIKIEGAGNLQMVTAPDIKWPAGIEAFEPAATETLDKTTVPVSGYKMLSWDFTAAEPGNYVLPPVVFSYFDPVAATYKTDSTQPLSFTVTKGSGKKLTTATATEEKKSGLGKFFGNRRWVVSSIAVLIVLGLLFWLNNDRRKEEKAAEEEAAAVAAAPPVSAETEPIVDERKEYLSSAGILLYGGDSTAFYKALDQGLKEYLAATLKLPAATLNKRAVTTALDEKNVAAETVVQLQNLMNEIELQLYTPFAEREKMEELYNATSGMIQLLDTYKN